MGNKFHVLKRKNKLSYEHRGKLPLQTAASAHQPETFVAYIGQIIVHDNMSYFFKVKREEFRILLMGHLHDIGAFCR